MTFETIRYGLLDAGLTEDELLEVNRLIIRLLKDARARQSRLMRRSLSAGDRVTWTGGQSQGRGRKRLTVTKTGVVESVKRKFAHVKDDDSWQTWRVPMSMLTILED